MTEGLAAHMDARARRDAILNEIIGERASQDRKWGEQNHAPFTWLAILGEEVGEANKAALESVIFRPLEDTPVGAEPTKMWLASALKHYREELIQVAAVALAMVECLDRDQWPAAKEP